MQLNMFNHWLLANLLAKSVLQMFIIQVLMFHTKAYSVSVSSPRTTTSVTTPCSIQAFQVQQSSALLASSLPPDQVSIQSSKQRLWLHRSTNQNRFCLYQIFFYQSYQDFCKLLLKLSDLVLTITSAFLHLIHQLKKFCRNKIFKTFIKRLSLISASSSVS